MIFDNDDICRFEKKCYLSSIFLNFDVFDVVKILNLSSD